MTVCDCNWVFKYYYVHNNMKQLHKCHFKKHVFYINYHQYNHLTIFKGESAVYIYRLDASVFAQLHIKV
jgi:hypothetical protein